MHKDRVEVRASGMTDRSRPTDAGPLTLPETEVHVWCLSLDRSPEDRAPFFSLLSPDETARAERFFFEKDRDHYAVARGLLRTLLGGYLREEPSRIGFTYGSQGKPALGAARPGKPLEFNVSHSGGTAGCAFKGGVCGRG